MSGHSKWATIHRDKEVTDQKRGQIFTKISTAIIVAVRDGGGVTDPEFNFKLRLAVEKARSVNMPKENIQRAIDRASGKGEGVLISEVSYEGYGPSGVGIIVEVTTDNKQRTIQEIKNIFDKNGGSIASPGSVTFNFQKVGLITVPISGNTDEEILKIIDLGVDEVEEIEDKNLQVLVSPDRLVETGEKLIAAGFQPSSVELSMKPINLISINEKKSAEQILSFVEKLESNDDVQRVYANFDIPDELLKDVSNQTP